MRHVLPVSLLLLALCPGSSPAQTRPDFSGTWSLPPDAPLAPNGKPAPAPGFGPTINIVHEGSSITIAKVLGGGTVHVAHTLDGSETRSRTPGRLCVGDTQSIWTAAWQGDAILTTLVATSPPGAPPTTKMDVKTAFTLQPPDRLAVEMTCRNAGMTEPRTVTTVYRKTGPPSPVPAAPATPLQATIAQAGFLAGTWVGTTGSSTSEERWTPAAGGSMLAISRTMRNGNMNAFEFLCVVERNGGLVYQAMPNGRQPATDFTLTKIEPGSLTFENPAHDFPKMIRYTLGADGTLEAVVSGTEKQKPLVFRFRKE
jgi:hypothetical protein